ncbi:MAG: TRAP transporter small permease [Desulfovibrionaceae bacterium]|nr:TRAP transporter small permease [Desulfovibrionaceae bacterium]
MTRLLNLIDALLKKLTIVCIALMLIIVFAQVITRYCFNYTPVFGEELSRYLFVWTVFLSLPLLARVGGHMAIETLTNRLKGARLKVCRIIADIFSLIFLAIMVWNGCKMVMLAHFQTSPAMMLPMSYVYCVIPFGCFVMLLYTIENLMGLLRTPADEVR